MGRPAARSSAAGAAGVLSASGARGGGVLSVAAAVPGPRRGRSAPPPARCALDLRLERPGSCRGTSPSPDRRQDPDASTVRTSHIRTHVYSTFLGTVAGSSIRPALPRVGATGVQSRARAMDTFATLALPGTYVGPAGQPLVGRLVANTELLKAFFRHASFARYCFFVGEAADREALHQLFVEPGHLAPERHGHAEPARAAGGAGVGRASRSCITRLTSISCSIWSGCATATRAPPCRSPGRFTRSAIRAS